MSSPFLLCDLRLKHVRVCTKVAGLETWGELDFHFFSQWAGVRVAEIIEFYSFWGFNLCKFSMVKKYQFGLSKPWIYFGICLYPGPLLEIQHKTRLQRGWVSESPENLTFRWIYLQDDPRRGNRSKASEHVAEWLSEVCFFHMFTTFIRNCDGAGSLSGQVSPEFSGLRWVYLSGFSSCPSLGHLLAVHSTPLRAFPPAHQGQGLVSEIRAILHGDPEHQADITLFVILSSGWDF